MMPTFGTSGDVAVGNDVGVLGQLDGGVLLHERVGHGTALGSQPRDRRQHTSDDPQETIASATMHGEILSTESQVEMASFKLLTFYFRLRL